MKVSQAQFNAYHLHNLNAQIVGIRQGWEQLDEEDKRMLAPYAHNLNEAMNMIRQTVFALEKTVIPTIEAKLRKTPVVLTAKSGQPTTIAPSTKLNENYKGS